MTELIDRAAAAAGETMKLMMVLLPTGLLLMPLGGLRDHRTQPDGARPCRIAPPNSVLNRLSVRAARLQIVYIRSSFDSTARTITTDPLYRLHVRCFRPPMKKYNLEPFYTDKHCACGILVASQFVPYFSILTSLPDGRAFVFAASGPQDARYVHVSRTDAGTTKRRATFATRRNIADLQFSSPKVSSRPYQKTP